MTETMATALLMAAAIATVVLMLWADIRLVTWAVRRFKLPHWVNFVTSLLTGFAVTFVYKRLFSALPDPMYIVSLLVGFMIVVGVELISMRRWIRKMRKELDREISSIEGPSG